jgi:RNA polymerase sigma factor (sigma-70 family)
MSGRKVVCRNWIVDLGRDPVLVKNQRYTHPHGVEFVPLNKTNRFHLSDESVWGSQKEQFRLRQLKEKVSEAVRRLPENEREFIERYYFMGQSYREIADQTGRVTYKLELLHRRAFKLLRKELKEFVRERFGVVVKDFPKCQICNSKFHDQIDYLIATRDKKRSWRPVIKEIRGRFGIKIKTPQTLIGHEKYH